jgi:hypothetical protein
MSALSQLLQLSGERPGGHAQANVRFVWASQEVRGQAEIPTNGCLGPPVFLWMAEHRIAPEGRLTRSERE